ARLDRSLPGGMALAIPQRAARQVYLSPQPLEFRMWQTLKETFKEWTEDKVPRLSAALAFYTMLSLAPLLIIGLKVVMLFVHNKQNAQDQIANYVSSVSSPQTADTVNQIFQKQAEQPHTGTLATIISLVILLVSASGVFGELQT